MVGDPGRSEHQDERPVGYVSVSVMLIVPDTRQAAAWYHEALGATILWDVGGVAGLQIGGAPFFLHDANPRNPTEATPAEAGVTSARVELFLDDPEGALERALSAGATLGRPVEAHEAPWGQHRQGAFRDPFGHTWSVGDRTPLARHAAR